MFGTKPRFSQTQNSRIQDVSITSQSSKQIGFPFASFSLHHRYRGNLQGYMGHVLEKSAIVSTFQIYLVLRKLRLNHNRYGIIACLEK